MTRDERRLLNIFRGLTPPHATALLEFAEFLEAKSQREAPTVLVPLAIPRASEESVVKAIKRLSATYPMLDKGRLFNETSTLMTQHVMQGRPAPEVIDELEALFKRFYDEFVSGRSA